MNRRHYLATVAAVVIAGCAGDSNGDEPESEGNNSPATNSTPAEIDDGGDEGPTDDEKAVNHISAAEDALESAVGELEDRTGDSLDETIDLASNQISIAPIEDHLSEARSEASAAAEFGFGGTLPDRIDGVQAVEEYLRVLVEGASAYNALYSNLAIYLDPASSLSIDLSADAENSIHDATGSDSGTVRSKLSTAEAERDRLSESFDAITTEQFDEVLVDFTLDDLQGQFGRLDVEVRNAGAVVDGIDEIAAVEDVFWPARAQMQAGEIDGLNDEFENAEADLASVRNSLSVRSWAYEPAVTWVDGYAGVLETAAAEYDWELAHREAGNHERAEERRNNAEAALEMLEDRTFDGFE